MALTHATLPAPVFDEPTRVLIVTSPYYTDIAEQLVTGARAACEASRVMYDEVSVPGALEIPQAMAIAAKSGQYDGFVALGCVIRGETTHYETVCNDSSAGLMRLGLQGLCIGNGILTVENAEQAMVRAEAAGQNKGGGAAEAAFHLITLKRRFTPDNTPRRAPEGEILLAKGGDTV
ncbi:6,7-dimethyl-8-ribityllumazine synthase [Oceanibium sediminis]|uniref:6,7-dimethyl-8-ribityllumazine synthase n=1 Tax=Oceanibium sediminis TaxID=2026339 RepID=UPI000DD33BDC|nr:6,7-dimethyl-8-ribityllumazine synthase [Oceanibium sediminis]